MWYSQKEDHIFIFMKQLKEFDPNIVIETDRLVLRYMKSGDRHAIFVNINNDKEVLKYFLDKYFTRFHFPY